MHEGILEQKVWIVRSSARPLAETHAQAWFEIGPLAVIRALPG